MALVIKGIAGQVSGQPFKVSELTFYPRTSPLVNPSIDQIFPVFVCQDPGNLYTNQGCKTHLLFPWSRAGGCSYRPHSYTEVEEHGNQEGNWQCLS